MPLPQASRAKITFPRAEPVVAVIRVLKVTEVPRDT
jgi:hypothetical protein